MTSPDGCRRWSSRSRRPRRLVLLVAAAMMLVGVSCGGADDTGETNALSDPTAGPRSEAPPTADAMPQPTAADATMSSDDPTADDVSSAPWPGPALPVLRTFELDQPISNPIAFVEGALFMGSPLGVGRLDVETGEFDQITTVQPGQFVNTTFVAHRTGSTVMVLTDVDSLGGREAIVAIDPATFTESGRIDTASGYEFGFGVSDEFVISIENGDRYAVVDPATLVTRPLPVAGGAAQPPAVLGDEIWTIEREGDVVVYDRASGEERRRGRLPLEPGAGQGVVTRVTDREVWVTLSRDAVIVALDRATLAVVDQIDFAELHGAENATSLLVGDRYYLVRMFETGRSGWNVLGRYDFEAGELVHVHTVAPTDPGFGWDVFLGATWAEGGDRLFVQDHRRRIIEVDVERLANPSTEEWKDPGLARDPILSAEEQALGDIVLASVNDGVRERRTRPDAVTPEVLAQIDAMAAAFIGFQPAAWRLDTVAIEGDRGWVWIYPVDETGESATGALPSLLVTHRVDGEWFIETDWTCLFLSTLGVECAP